ncbi:hypothetical protein ACFQNJ_01280 [Hydrogenophaga bisanensis]|uniref:Uncharacterized protein n=1 Tax=Hydrogenophaga bisanensis TaxID=439611 RepID=A0ABW2R6R3_9BURK
MQHDLFSSLDFFLSVPAGSGGLLIRDVTGQYHPAEADEVLLDLGCFPAHPHRARSLCAGRAEKKKPGAKAGQIQSRCHTTFQGGGPTVQAGPEPLSIQLA